MDKTKALESAARLAQNDGFASGWMITALAVLILVIVVLWIFLPFAVFAIRRKAEVLVVQAARTNELLEILVRRGEIVDQEFKVKRD